jgi:transposase
VVSREVGVSVGTLERWRAQALAAPGELANSQRWTPAARLEAVITTAAMDEAARSAWCRGQGLYPAELEAWKRDAITGLGEPRAASAVEARQDRRRVKELKRELHRKDKARQSPRPDLSRKPRPRQPKPCAALACAGLERHAVARGVRAGCGALPRKLLRVCETGKTLGGVVHNEDSAEAAHDAADRIPVANANRGARHVLLPQAAILFGAALEQSAAGFGLHKL